MPQEAAENGADVEILAGGVSNEGRIVRVGGHVIRPAHAGSVAVAELLRHLERVGFDGAPRFVEHRPDGTDVVTFIEGVVPRIPYEPWVREPATATSVAALLRRYRAAVASFVPRPELRWNSRVPAPWCGGDAVGHNDCVRSNVVFRDGVAVGLIDFDLAAPSAAVYDVALAVSHWIPLRGEEDGDAPDALDRTVTRLHDFLGATGLGLEDRLAAIDAVVALEYHNERTLRALVDEGVAGYVELARGGAMERIRQRQEWLARHGDALRRGLRRRRP